MRKSNYDKFPFVPVPGSDGACVAGWDSIARRLREAVEARGQSRSVIVIDCYPGVDEAAVANGLRSLQPALVIRAADAMRSPAEIDRLCEPFLGGNDPVFGFVCPLELPQLTYSDQRPRCPRTERAATQVQPHRV